MRIYSPNGLDHLAMLVRETHNRGVEFVYAIAPGLDITFSDEKDVLALKRKLEQVCIINNIEVCLMM